MLKRLMILLLLLMVSFSTTAAFASDNIPTKDNEMVSMQLKRFLIDKKEISLKIKGNYLINNLASEVLSEGINYTVKVENTTTLGLYKNGSKVKSYQSNNFLITPVTYGESNYAIINNRGYLGDIMFTVENGEYVRPINTLPLRDYLKGVVPEEMYSTWNVEALKAQTVAARTYAKARLGKIIDDTVKYQAYGGYTWQGSIYKNSNAAVEATAGEVLRYNGKLIDAVYSSSNGGFIESNASYWGGTQFPYLTARKDPFDPIRSWIIDINKQQIATSQLDLSHPEKWWGTVTEKDAKEKYFINTKNFLLGKINAKDIKIVGIPTVSFANEFTKTATGESTGKRTKGTIHVEYYMKDSNGKYVMGTPETIPSDFETTLWGSTRYETSVAISKQGWPTTANTVVLGRGDLPVDALTGTVLAKKYNAPLLLTTTNLIQDSVLTRIKELKPQNIYLLGGTGAISDAVKTKLESLGITVERINGADRYDTSVAVAEKIGSFSEVFITYGGNDSPDALSIASYAAAKQIPVILSNTNSLSESTKKLLQNKKVNKVTLVGGTGVVSTNIENQIKSLGISNVERVSGIDRFATSIAIAKKYSFNEEKVYFAQGRIFIDALPGAVLAAMNNAPVILTEKSVLPEVDKQWLKTLSNRPNVVYLGGSGAISTSTKNLIKQALFGQDAIKKFVYKLDNVPTSTLRSMYGGTVMNSYHVVNVQSDATKFTINGLGSGHAVGMSQWGAQNMATFGKNYKQILSHYYPSTTLTY